NLPPSTVEGYLSFTPQQGNVITNVSIMGNTYLSQQQTWQNTEVQWGTINIRDQSTGMNEVVNYYTPQGFTTNGDNFQVILNSNNNTLQQINGANYYTGNLIVENVATGKIREVTYYLQQPQQQYYVPPQNLTPQEQEFAIILTGILVGIVAIVFIINNIP
ncbi:MAG: hypothetical protein QXD11_02555, partial [Candidatus Micrarchaeaceae archaeon]